MLDAETMRWMPARMPANSTLNDTVDVVLERGGIRHETVHRDRGEVHDRVELAEPGGDAEQRIEGLAVVREVDAGESGARRAGEVESEHLMPVGPQPLDGGRAQLAG